MEETKSSSKNYLWLLLGCLGLIVVACTAGVIIGALSLFFITPEISQSASPLFPEPTRAVVSTAPVEPTPTLPPTNTPIPNDESVAPVTAEPTTPAEVDEPLPTLSDPNAAKRAEIESGVARIRGLKPSAPVLPTILTADELRVRLEEDLLEEYGPEEARLDAIALSAFDFIPADFNLYSFLLDLYAEQIAGYYDPENNEFVIISGDSAFGGVEQLTHAHEFVHALQDQHFDLEKLDDESLGSEELFAFQSFIEGEATLVQMQFLESGFFDFEELAELLMDLLGSTLSLDMDILQNAPPVLAHELEFPYMAGMNFAQTIFSDGGYEALNQVWGQPPVSTEQILHPERYLSRDEPVEVTWTSIEEALGTGWEEVDDDTLGEFYLREYLAQHLEGSEVDVAASGWGGDRYVVYYKEGDQQIAMVLRLAWDSPLDGDQFEEAYRGFAANRSGATGDENSLGAQCWVGQDVVCLASLDGDSLIVRAPDSATADLMLSKAVGN